MRSGYWKDQWDRKAREEQDVRLVSGWGDRTFQEMLFSINDIADKLDIQRCDRLLDAGCGAGLFEIAFARWVEEIYGVDYSQEMVRIAQKNTEIYKNVHIQQCNFQNIPYETGFFDKVLVNSVIQYLDNPSEVVPAVKELDRVTKDHGIILLSLIPSAETKEALLDGYNNMGLTSEEAKKKIENNSNILWFYDQELKDDLEHLGFSDIRIAQPVDRFQKKYYFDLIIRK